MKTSVIYYSKTGHSEKIATAIAQSFGIEPLNIKDNPILEDVDLLFVVGGIYGGKCSPEIQDYLSNLQGPVQKAVLITSCLGKITPQKEVRAILQDGNIEVDEEEFICQGSFLLLGRKHPDATDIEDAVAFAKDIAEKYATV